ncbi:DUF58 domain-containing protein [Bosea caraganae]|uniref:DUF58 domain-containing protein n=1 Tax=Bosea caraganae TaxID=2763117 RepID=A0A370KYI8_9HYPH|nr:DUF58 domain-containing protein [Bosea caraganae]RDJ19682.1 DUF58 domain-containing protein [Bosea caraganae]RDJ23826.1 DUF58 domain-containing protein [Bosea caraganae]
MTPTGEGTKAGGAASARAFVTLDDLMRLKHRAQGFSFLPRQPVHSLLAGRHASRLRGRGLNFEELRHYFEGDDTRTIDWLATARLRSPHVRVYSEERDRPVVLLVDQRSTMFFGSRRAMKSVAAAEAAALAAWRVTSLGDRVGAVVFGDRGIAVIKPQARERGVMRVLWEVIRQNAALAGPGDAAAAAGRLNEALRAAARLAVHDCLVCLISDAAGEDEETVRLITGIGAHNDVIAAFVHDPMEKELPDVGTATFSLGDRQIEVDASSSALRGRFARDRAGWGERLSRLSRNRAIPVLPISTGRDVADQFRELIGRRQAQRLADAGGRAAL